MRPLPIDVRNVYIHFVLLIERIVLGLFRTLGIKKIKTRTGVWLKAQYSDASFRFQVSRAFAKSSYFESIAEGGPFIFIDVGANQGAMSIAAAKKVNCLGVVAFEPSPNNLLLLKHNLGLNNCEHKVKVLANAIGPKSQMSYLMYKPKHSGNSQIVSQDELYPDVQPSRHKFELQKVNTWSEKDLDDFFKSSDHNAPAIHLKIDTEGGEEEILNTFLRTVIAKQIRSVRVEVSKYNSEQKIIDLLRSNGFSEDSRYGADPRHFDLFAVRTAQKIEG